VTTDEDIDRLTDAELRRRSTPPFNPDYSLIGWLDRPPRPWPPRPPHDPPHDIGYYMHMTDWPVLRRLLILAAGIAAVVLALVVLIGNPHNPTDLLAWAGFSAGVGLVLVAAG
jgi:hypothetical protein